MDEQASPSSNPLLSVRDITIAFGGNRAVDGLSFDVPSARVLSLIGPNGAGKTTVLNSISGFVRARGAIVFRDVELLRKPAYARASLGIGRTFQNLELFRDMTVLDNVMVGRHAAIGGNMLFDLVKLPVMRREREARRRSIELLDLVGIGDYAERTIEGLPFGIQKLAGVARALAVDPSLLLLDEPAAGLNRQESDGLGETILHLRQRLGLTILLVEHDMRLVMGISDSVVVLDHGNKLAEGAPSEISTNSAVIEAYLGEVEGTGIVEEVQGDLAERS